ncbi:hypothetical protein VNO77_01992 [Canavalia gladiata]|uniref:Uncharacterized protein n=1 Tax=Canavalia gladiata TaxID=3824 RepID=A0AAN9R2M4_CANGL
MSEAPSLTFETHPRQKAEKIQANPLFVKAIYVQSKAAAIIIGLHQASSSSHHKIKGRIRFTKFQHNPISVDASQLECKSCFTIEHMPTKYKNLGLLPISGVFGHSINGLSSFDSMDQEKGDLKSKMDRIEMGHPNVMKLDMTLVLDMKLHRLGRVVQCTGSPILSSDDLNGQKLRHCDFVYFEKFVEEYDGPGEGGKKSIKILMFIEGCPTRLGCTILVKGMHSDELKGIKCVMRCAVVMAYHLTLETSFLD